MPTRELLSEAQRPRFSGIPEMDTRGLARHHTLSGADLTAVSVRRGAANRLGFAVQLCLFRHPGRPLRAGEVVPRSMVEFVASQIGADPAAFAAYAGGPEGTGRDTTRREHVAEIVRTFGLRTFDARVYRDLARWLLPIAEGTDSGEALVGALLEEMRRREIVAPALSMVERLAWETRRRARESVFRKLVADLDEERLDKFDSLLVALEGETPLNRIRRPPGPSSPKNFRDVLDEVVGWERFVASVAEAENLALPANFDYLDFLEAGHTHVRRYAPALLEAFDFRAAPSAEPLIEAVGILKEMNEKGRRKVPEDAPVSFVKPRWRDHVVGPEGEIDRRYYELSALSELKNGLRSGDMWGDLAKNLGLCRLLGESGPE